MSVQHDLHQKHKERMARLWRTPQQQAAKIVAAQAIKKPEASIVLVGADEWDAYESAAGETTHEKLQRIIREVAVAHRLSIGDLRCPGRTANLCAARFEYCYRAAAETKASLSTIAKLIKRDHTTILGAIGSYCIKMGLPLPRNAQWSRWRKAVAHV